MYVPFVLPRSTISHPSPTFRSSTCSALTTSSFTTTPFVSARPILTVSAKRRISVRSGTTTSISLDMSTAAVSLGCRALEPVAHSGPPRAQVLAVDRAGLAAQLHLSGRELQQARYRLVTAAEGKACRLQVVRAPHLE